VVAVTPALEATAAAHCISLIYSGTDEAACASRHPCLEATAAAHYNSLIYSGTDEAARDGRHPCLEATAAAHYNYLIISVGRVERPVVAATPVWRLQRPPTATL
jgi:hypothetical protein